MAEVDAKAMTCWLTFLKILDQLHWAGCAGRLRSWSTPSVWLCRLEKIWGKMQSKNVRRWNGEMLRTFEAPGFALLQCIACWKWGVGRRNLCASSRRNLHYSQIVATVSIEKKPTSKEHRKTCRSIPQPFQKNNLGAQSSLAMDKLGCFHALKGKITSFAYTAELSRWKWLRCTSRR